MAVPEGDEYPQYDHACFYGCTHPDHEGPMSLLDRYNRFEDLTLDTLYTYGEKYTAQDYMDLQRLVIRVYEAVTNGELEAGLRMLEEEYKGLERTVLQDEYDEEMRNRER